MDCRPQLPPDDILRDLRFAQGWTIKRIAEKYSVDEKEVYLKVRKMSAVHDDATH